LSFLLLLGISKASREKKIKQNASLNITGFGRSFASAFSFIDDRLLRNDVAAKIGKKESINHKRKKGALRIPL
jgi:hypothetical protein